MNKHLTARYTVQVPKTGRRCFTNKMITNAIRKLNRNACSANPPSRKRTLKRYSTSTGTKRTTRKRKGPSRTKSTTSVSRKKKVAKAISNTAKNTALKRLRLESLKKAQFKRGHPNAPYPREPLLNKLKSAYRGYGSSE